MPTSVYVAISSTSKTGNTVVGGGGATYAATFSTFTLAFADATYGARDLVSLDETAIYQLFEDITDTVNINSGTWNATTGNKIIVEAEETNRHGGLYTAGVEVTGSSGFGFIVTTATNAVALVQYLKVTNTAGTGHGISVVSNCVAHACLVDSQGTGVNLTNGTAYNCTASYTGTAAGTGFAFGGFSTNILYNCVAHNKTSGITEQSSGTLTLRNCAAVDNTTDFTSGSSTLTASNNASSDTTALGTSAQINVVSTDAFINPGSQDFHLKAGSVLIDNGFNLSGTNDTDFDGQPWTIPYSIGADQPGTFTVPILIIARDPSDNSFVVGARIYGEAATGGPLTVGDQIFSEVTDSNGEINYDMPFTSPQPMTGKGRKGTATPFHKQAVFLGDVLSDGFEQTIFMSKDE